MQKHKDFRIKNSAIHIEDSDKDVTKVCGDKSRHDCQNAVKNSHEHHPSPESLNVYLCAGF